MSRPTKKDTDRKRRELEILAYFALGFGLFLLLVLAAAESVGDKYKYVPRPTKVVTEGTPPVDYIGAVR